MIKKYFSNPYFLLLLTGNLYCIWYFQSSSNGFTTVLWIYWMQSIIIGLFNFIDLLTLKNFSSDGTRLNGAPVTNENKGCLPWFFLVHFGGFHFVYAIFLLIKLSYGPIEKTFFLIGVAAFFAESLMAFVRRKSAEQELKFNIGSLFFLPYLRIVPMHLVILAPAFLGWQPSTIFLVLKTLADVISFILYQRMWEKAMLK